MQMIIFKCMSSMCDTHFALEKGVAVSDGEEIVCPACSGHEWVELGPAEFPMPTEPAEKVVVRRTCRVCGCTQYNACEEGCWWVEDNLCSTCVDQDSEHVSPESGMPPNDSEWQELRESLLFRAEKLRVQVFPEIKNGRELSKAHLRDLHLILDDIERSKKSDA